MWRLLDLELVRKLLLKIQSVTFCLSGVFQQQPLGLGAIDGAHMVINLRKSLGR